MTVAQSAAPAFGKADLSNCEREQIHFAGSIQPHGTLLTFRAPHPIIIQAGANAEVFLGLTRSLVGAHLSDLGGTLWRRIKDRFGAPPEAIPFVVRCDLGDPAKPFNALLHRAPSGEIVIELERSGPAVDFAEPLGHALQRVLASTTLRALSDECVDIFRSLTGYDRVMVYRFDEEGHGEVFSESKKTELEAFRGNRYPATDIPQIARRLYERNRVRLLADLRYQPVPLVPALSPATGRDLDMSLCFLRSVSPIHVQYLGNMGVTATLVVSLMVGGRLWGLVSCHHYSPRSLHFEMRAVCELLAEAVGTRIAALESFLRGQSELAVRRLEQRMIDAISREGDWRGALFDASRSLLAPLHATGAALLFEGQIRTAGDVPSTEQIRKLAAWIAPRLRGGLFVTVSLGSQDAVFAPLVGVASGVVATGISGEAEEMVIWFRHERVRTVTWGGNPEKPPSSGDHPSELSPRRSFAQWHQVVEGTSEPWTPPDLTTARLIGASVSDVILQFRAVRILIAQDQLQKVLGQVRSSDQHVMVADASGRVIECNASVDALIGVGQGGLGHLGELPALFVNLEEVHRKIEGLLGSQLAWRGEAHLRDAEGREKFLLIRADPVLSGPGRVLGFVLMFADLTERKVAEAARRRFQEGIFKSRRSMPARDDVQAEVKLQTLLSDVVENAQLAALEIADGSDTENMPAMLESIRTSVARTVEVLEQLSAEPPKAPRGGKRGGR